jgi:hypothetical protein
VREISPLTVEFRQADGQHRQFRVEVHAGRRPVVGQRCGQFAGDRTLARPAVHEDDVGRVVVGGEVVEGDGVDTSAPHDGDGVVLRGHGVPEAQPAADQDGDRGSGSGQ